MNVAAFACRVGATARSRLLPARSPRLGLLGSSASFPHPCRIIIRPVLFAGKKRLDTWQRRQASIHTRAVLTMSASGSSLPVAVIVGTGSKHDKDGAAAEHPPESRWGLGGSLALRFAAGGFHVALLGRRQAILDAVAAEVRDRGGEATPVIVDVGDDESVSSAFSAVRGIAGDEAIQVMVFNTSPSFPPGSSFGNFPAPHELSPDYMTQALNTGVTGCLRCVREVVPGMLNRGTGTILLSGATMALRGGPQFACLSPVKFGLRSFGQSMAQEYAPKGIHVAHVIIDGVIDSPNTRPWGENMQLMQPYDLADAFFALHEQKPTVWSHEVQLGPQRGNLGMRL